MKAAQPPTLLSLPLEIRFMIYEKLFGPEPISYPFGHSPISNVSRGPPPEALLETCHQIGEEIRNCYYGAITFRSRVDPRSSVSEQDTSPNQDCFRRSIRALRQARKIELMICDHYAFATEERLKRALETLLGKKASLLKEEGHTLNILIISLTGWSHRELLLDPAILLPLKGRVKYVVGEVIASRPDFEEELRSSLENCIRKLNE